MPRLPLRKILIAFLFLASPCPNLRAQETQYAGAETCGACHEAEYAEWTASRHAQAFSESFKGFWNKLGDPPECLACHTTGYDPSTHAFAAEGVSCESCHGALKEGHPEQPMGLLVDSEACKQCHLKTYQEWQISGHAKAGLRCFDCHSVHGQGLRYPEAEQQCGACHAQRMEDFVHGAHHEAGLTCTTCHMPEVESTGIGGAGAPGHSYFVGAQTCAACHDEMVHKSNQIATLREEVEHLSEQSLAEQNDALAAKVRALELAVDIERNRRMKWAISALFIGVFLGLMIFGRDRNGWHNADNGRT